MCEIADSEDKDFNPISVGSRSRKRYGKSKKRIYVCSFDDCLKSYFTRTHLIRHEEIHSGKLKCPVDNCGAEFKTRFTLQKHKDIVHLKKKHKKYKCSYCDEEFNKHTWLTKHLFRHTGIKPYLCTHEGCGKRFDVPSKLKRHMKVHKGYTCTKENCDKIFQTWTAFREHIQLSHPTIHKCHYCDKEFSRSGNFKLHMEFHNLDDRKAFHCPKPNCTRFYRRQSALNHHLRSFHAKRPYVCPQEHCHKEFKSEADMINHCSLHYQRKRKKKKKSHTNPSFAARLAGLVPKKWQLQKSPTKTPLLQPIIEPNPEDTEETFYDYTSGSEKNEIESESSNVEEVVSGHNSLDISSLTDDENTTTEEECSVDNGIQMLLNIIEERNRFSNESTVR